MEPDATANALELGEHETTGLLPVGFAFERFGARYDHFDLSSDGFIRFGGVQQEDGPDERVPLSAEGRGRLGAGRVTYEVRGVAPRRRLVLTFTEPGLSRAAFQLIVYERTGIVDLSDRPVRAWETPRFDSSTWSTRPLASRTQPGKSGCC